MNADFGAAALFRGCGNTAPDKWERTTMTYHLTFPRTRCGDFLGRASAGLIILALAGFALAAVLIDLSKTHL